MHTIPLEYTGKCIPYHWKWIPYHWNIQENVTQYLSKHVNNVPHWQYIHLYWHYPYHWRYRSMYHGRSHVSSHLFKCCGGWKYLQAGLSRLQRPWNLKKNFFYRYHLFFKCYGPLFQLSLSYTTVPHHEIQTHDHTVRYTAITTINLGIISSLFLAKSTPQWKTK